jgi:GMP synthase (glutamine-hydrolysing)
VSRPLRFLVLDSYDRAGRADLVRFGASEAGALYARALAALEPDAEVDVAHPADADRPLPEGVALGDYDGLVWTGSSLSVRDAGKPEVRRQIDLVRAALDAGAASFGSCFAAQLLATAEGGAVRANPKGREFGIARKIEITDAGRDHPLFAGKPAVFDAFTSHGDEIEALPPGIATLASNGWTRVQALAVRRGRGEFWAVQYHPEYDLAEIAHLARARAPVLVAQGTFRDEAAAAAWAEDVLALAADAGRRDLAWRLAIDRDVTEPASRLRELANWIERLVKPRAAVR